MTPKEFIESIKRTEVQDRPPVDPKLLRVLHGVMGVVKEASEVMDILEKHIFFGKPLELERMLDEIGDTNYYMGMLIDSVGLTYEDTFEYNSMKLNKRYPNGFDPEGKEKRG